MAHLTWADVDRYAFCFSKIQLLKFPLGSYL